MMRFAEVFPELEIVQTGFAQLAWSHSLEIIDTSEKQEKLAHWSILCSEKDQEQIELLQLEQGGIRVTQYLTELPPQPILQAKLMIRIARSQVIASRNP